MFVAPDSSGSSVLNEREPHASTWGLFAVNQAGYVWPTETSLSSQSLPPQVGLPGGELEPKREEDRQRVRADRLARGAASIATVIRGSTTGEQERMTVGGVDRGQPRFLGSR